MYSGGRDGMLRAGGQDGRLPPFDKVVEIVQHLDSERFAFLVVLRNQHPDSERFAFLVVLHNQHPDSERFAFLVVGGQSGFAACPPLRKLLKSSGEQALRPDFRSFLRGAD
ncbi:MAG: hypothetical protein LKE79_06660 [Lachnospiraceae bacterium]|nr:hypothetical protein [Lachnospiraceae bacterium]